MTKALLCLTSAFALAAGAFAKGKPVMNWNGQHCGVQAAEHRLIETQDAWQALWKEIGKPAPAADFKTQFAVAVFAGPQRTGGYSVKWEEPKREGDALRVRFSVQGPPEGRMVIQAFTEPWGVRVFERPKDGVSIVVEGLP